MATPKFPTPVLKTLWPFAAGGMSITHLTSAALTYGLIWKAAGAMQDSDEYINDPRHPRFSKGGKFIDLEKRT